MIDGIINESLNSRRIKAALPATYEALVAMAAADGIPADVLFSEAGWRQLPTLLSKSTLLSDNTEIAIWGNASNRTVDAALKVLADVAYGRVAFIDLTVLDTEGNPIPDVVVKVDGEPDLELDELTNEDGFVRLLTSGGVHTVHLLYPMGYTGETSSHELEVSGTRELLVQEFARSSSAYFVVPTSSAFRIARYLSPAEFDVRGAGGSGGIQTNAKYADDLGSDTYLRAQGGAAGYATLTGPVDVAGKIIRVTPGAGGLGIKATKDTGTFNGNAGGVTSLAVGDKTFTAAGGHGGLGGSAEENTAGGSKGGGGAPNSYSNTINDGGNGLPLFGDSDAYGGGGGGAYNRGGGGKGENGSKGSPHGTSGVYSDSIPSSGVSSKDATYSGGSGGVAAFDCDVGKDDASSGKGGDGFVAFRKAV